MNYLSHAEEYIGSLEEAQVTPWIIEAPIWDNYGVYNVAARLLDAKTKKVHVDIGSGLGHLLIHLKRDNPQCLTIGIDNNFAMLTAASMFIEREGLIYSLDAYRIMQETQGMVKRVYSASPAVLSGDILKNKKPIFLIGDDIRTPQVLPHLLKRRQLDSASLILPGSAVPAAYESPYPLEVIDRETTIRRITEIMDVTRKAAFKTVSHFVKPGGVFLLAERLPVHLHHSIDWVNLLIRSNLASYKAENYWDIEQILFLDMDLKAANSPFLKPGLAKPPYSNSNISNIVIANTKSNIDLAAYGKGNLNDIFKENPEEFATTVVWSKFVRNEEPFKESA